MKKHEVKLTSNERSWLEQFTNSGSANHQAFKRAQILLASAEVRAGTDAELAKVIGVSEATIYNTRRRYREEGCEVTVQRKAYRDKGVPLKVDGRVEAPIMA